MLFSVTLDPVFYLGGTLKKEEMPGEKMIILPIDVVDYERTINDSSGFATLVAGLALKHPELFPPAMNQCGFSLNGFVRPGSKVALVRRRILIQKESYLIHPCYVMPYLRGYTQEVSKGLFLRRHNLPYHAVSTAEGRNDMYWYRAELSLGSYSVVGTTIKSLDKLPLHIAIDEHHDELRGKKVYIATTVGHDCILGAQVCASVGAQELAQAYGVFLAESRILQSQYSPQSVNMDGFSSTQKASAELFPQALLILCFLHGFLKIRTWATKQWADQWQVVSHKVWHCYQAKTKRSFAQRIRRLQEWTQEVLPCSPFKNAIMKLCKKKQVHPGLRLSPLP